MYNKAKGRVMNYGWISESFNIERGVGQGCPLSSLIFIIIAEVLSTKIKQNRLINGVRLPSSNRRNEFVEVKISQFADDTAAFVDGVDSLNHLMQEIEKFGKYAGPKINWDKTKLVKLNTKI